jgi:hypothetical protein
MIQPRGYCVIRDTCIWCLFLAGNGDRTFAAPISVSIPWTSVLFAADVNNDKKPDIVGGNTVNLGNGGGTRSSLPTLCQHSYAAPCKCMIERYPPELAFGAWGGSTRHITSYTDHLHIYLHKYEEVWLRDDRKTLRGYRHRP